MSALANNYKRKNLSFVRGKGSYLFTKDGKKYLDFVIKDLLMIPELRKLCSL